MALAEQTSTPRIQDFLRANFASLLLDLGDYRQAADVLEGVVARGLDRFPIMRMRDLADAYLRLGRPDVALAWADKSLAECGERGRENVTCINALDRRAEAHAALGDDAAALADLREAMTTIESVRARLVAADFFKQQFHLVQEDLYSRAIALEVRRGQDAVALETAERGRARAFVDLLASRDLTLAAARERAGGETSVTADTAPFPAGSLPLVFRGASASAIAKASSADLLSDAVVPAASSTQLVATAARLQSTLISYWVTRNQVFIWVITSDGSVRSYQVDVRLSKLAELIRTTTPFGEGDQEADRTATGGADHARRGIDRRQARPRQPGASSTTCWSNRCAARFPAPPPATGARSSPSSRTVRSARWPSPDCRMNEAAICWRTTRSTTHRPAPRCSTRLAGSASDARNGSLLMVSDPVPPTLVQPRSTIAAAARRASRGAAPSRP